MDSAAGRVDADGRSSHGVRRARSMTNGLASPSTKLPGVNCWWQCPRSRQGADKLYMHGHGRGVVGASMGQGALRGRRRAHPQTDADFGGGGVLAVVTL